MSAVTPSANFNLSNEDWGKGIQILDENWTTLIQSAVDDVLIKKPELVGLAEEVCALVEGGLHRNPAVSRYRSRKERGLKVKTPDFDKVAHLLSNRLTVVCKIWEGRLNAMTSACDRDGYLVSPVLKNDRLSDAWRNQSEPALAALVKDQHQSIDAAHKSRDETLKAMEASCKFIVDHWWESEIGITAVLEKARDEILDDLRGNRDQVFEAVRNGIRTISFKAVLKARNKVLVGVSKARYNATYCATPLKVRDDITAIFLQLDEVAATLKKTHDKATVIFQQFYDEGRAHFQKIHDKATATLQMARHEAVIGREINEPITACEKFCDEAIAAEKAHCSTLENFKKYQHETISAFNKFRDLSISIHKAIKESRAMAMKSPNEATIKADFKKIEHQAIAVQKIHEELLAALKKDDEVLASLLKAQDEAMTLTQSLELQGEVLAYFLSQDRCEALLKKIEGEAITPLP